MVRESARARRAVRRSLAVVPIRGHLPSACSRRWGVKLPPLKSSSQGGRNLMKLATKLAALATVLGVVLFAGAGSALAWAPEGSATIHPGVMTFTGGSSFVNGAGQ